MQNATGKGGAVCVAREVPQVAARVAKSRRDEARRRFRRSLPSTIVLSPAVLERVPCVTHVTHGIPCVPHSPLWLLPAGLSDDELLAAYGGGAS